VREEFALDAPLLPFVRGGPLAAGGRRWGGSVLGGSCCTGVAAPDVGGKNWFVIPLLNCCGGGTLPGAPAPGKAAAGGGCWNCCGCFCGIYC